LKTTSLFIALLWRTVAVYLVLAVTLIICLAGLFALGIDVPPREVANSVAFIKLKPTFAYLAFILVVLVLEFGLNVNVVRLFAGQRLGLQSSAWRQYLIELSVLLAALAMLNVLVAFTVSIEAWINYRLFGQLTLLLVGIYVLTSRTSKLAAHGT
jgi:intracellular septation protein A